MDHSTDNLQPQEILEKSRKGIFHIIFGRTMVIILALAFQFYLLFSFLFSLAQYVPVFFGGILAFTAVMLLVILNSREDPTVKLSWSIVIAILPIFGSLLYLFVRLDLGHRVDQKRYAFTLRDSAAYIHQNEAVLERLKGEERNVYNLARYLHCNGGHTVYGNTEVTYFPLGEEKFREMLVRLEQAEKFIFMEYFTIGPSSMWDEILEILVRKAKEGVEVRVMYDGTSGGHAERICTEAAPLL